LLLWLFLCGVRIEQTVLMPVQLNRSQNIFHTTNAKTTTSGTWYRSVIGRTG